VTSPVRPFRSRLVHPERAADLVTPMVDSVDVPVRQPDLDDTAYDAPVSALYVYRQRRGAEQHIGVVCDVHHEAFRDRQVRGHEAVQPERVAALVRHFATAPARAELVALLHRAGPVFARARDEAMTSEPLVRFDGPAGLEQEVWRVPEPTASALADELGSATHYIADGHHRVAATVAGWRAAGGVPEAGLPCVIYPMDGLALSAFHRRVPGPTDLERVADLLGNDFVVEPAPGPPDCSGRLGVYAAGRWSTATYRGDRAPGTAGLDVAILHDRVLGPLGVEDRVLPLRLPVEELTAACDRDDGLLVTLAPPTLDLLIDVADRGEVMPPKTTYFDPKPCAGIFLRG
jgi:uncharacterized protein (DUF1015 family)